MRTKKSIIGQVISVFVMMLVISTLAGLTFLFVSSLKSNIGDTSSRTSIVITNESVTAVDELGDQLSDSTRLLYFADITSFVALNATSGLTITSGNYTFTSAGGLTAITDEYNGTDWNVSYDFDYLADEDAKAWLGTNRTEAAGYQVTSYLGILFLALIFGAVLTVILRMIIPYVNLGQEIGGF